MLNLNNRTILIIISKDVGEAKSFKKRYCKKNCLTLLFTLEDGELAMPVMYPDDELTEEPGEGTSSSSSLLFSDGDLTNSAAGRIKTFALTTS